MKNFWLLVSFEYRKLLKKECVDYPWDHMSVLRVFRQQRAVWKLLCGGGKGGFPLEHAEKRSGCVGTL